MKSFREIAEAVKSLSDDKIDKELRGKTIKTFKYDMEAAMNIAKDLKVDVITTKDNKFMHIDIDNKLFKKYNLKEVK